MNKRIATYIFMMSFLFLVVSNCENGCSSDKKSDKMEIKTLPKSNTSLKRALGEGGFRLKQVENRNLALQNIKSAPGNRKQGAVKHEPIDKQILKKMLPSASSGWKNTQAINSIAKKDKNTPENYTIGAYKKNSNHVTVKIIDIASQPALITRLHNKLKQKSSRVDIKPQRVQAGKMRGRNLHNSEKNTGDILFFVNHSVAVEVSYKSNSEEVLQLLETIDTSLAPIIKRSNQFRRAKGFKVKSGVSSKKLQQAEK